MKLITVKAQNTTNHGNPFLIFAPVDMNLSVKSALLVEGPTLVFELWQDVSYYFFIDPATSALYQRPGADLLGARILVLLGA
jgi:hypothetical protein